MRDAVAAMGEEFPQEWLTIAKHLVSGLREEDVRQVLGLSAREMADIVENPRFMRLRQWTGTQILESKITRDETWDGLESLALKNLVKALRFNGDPELNLRAAAIANKAVRRQREMRDTQLDVKHGALVHVTLNQRFVRELQEDKMQTLEGRVFRQTSAHEAARFLGNQEARIGKDDELNALARAFFDGTNDDESDE